MEPSIEISLFAGPLFFLLSIHDLNNVSKHAELILFPDDANFFMSLKDPTYANDFHLPSAQPNFPWVFQEYLITTL